MTKSVWIVLIAAVLSLAARANEPTSVSLRLHPPAPDPALATTAEPGTCDLASLRAVGWNDPSDGFVFATHPTARIDAQELHAAALASLLQLRLAAGGLHLFVLGAPTHAGLRFSFDGGLPLWRVRWPFC